MPDYIPGSDAEFDEFMDNFATYIAANSVALNMSAQDVIDSTTANTDWHTSYVDHQQAQNTAQGKTQTKNGKKTDAKAVVRRLTGQIQANPIVTDEQRRELGITVADEQGTALAAATVETLDPPLIKLDWSQRGQCTIHWGQNPNNERENAKPSGVKGVKLQFAVGGIPETEEEWKFLIDDTRSPHIHTVLSNDAITIAYRAQYIDNQLRGGPWSDPAVATITV